VPVLTFILHTCKATSGPRIGGLAALHCSADTEFSLTFKAQAAGLQPALDHLCVRVAAIFEKEQEYVVGAMQPAQSQV